ncbi:MAG: 30S ribosomal protein S2 [Thiotrichales bacterium]|nr:MAG: 30S ribosomal protein S2 [Thiotrichales bacterium]
MTKLTIRDFFKAGAHFGHKSCNWNPKMKRFIFEERDKIHLINLDITLTMYNKAVEVLCNLAGKNAKVLFVGTKKAAQLTIAEQAKRIGMPYVDKRWLGGALTNWKTVKLSIKKLKQLEIMEKDGAFEKMQKKEALQLKRKLKKLQANLGGIKDMNGIPNAIVIVDCHKENIALTEARQLKIPVIGIVDTNTDPDNIDYVIPANDDSKKAITLYLTGMVDAMLAAKETAKLTSVGKKESGKTETTVAKKAPAKKEAADKTETTVATSKKDKVSAPTAK